MTIDQVRKILPSGSIERTEVLPPGFMERTKVCTDPDYRGTTFVSTNADIATVLFAKGLESMLNGAPVPDKAKIYFSTSNTVVGLEFSSYLSRKDRWHPAWGIVVAWACTNCDERLTTETK